jgi:aliphatic nitrilase
MIQYPAYRIAAAHVAPVFLDTEASLDKATSLIAEAARAGARLIAFPESYLPGFPVWAALAAPIQTHELFKRFAAAAVTVPGPIVDRLCGLARRHGIFISMGLSEGTTASVGCLWNSNLLIGDDGTVLNHHRKLVPTYFEKMIWANGDGHGLRVIETALGRIGALICGENTNPLARYALMAQGEQLHISSYPPVWPTRPPEDSGNYDLAQAIRIRAGAHAFEAKVFNLVAAAHLDRTLKDTIAKALGQQALSILDGAPRGASMLIGPTGAQIGDSLSEDEGLLYADIDLAACVEPKQFHDVVGYYNRFDVFRFSVDRTRPLPASFADGPAGATPARLEDEPLS